MTDSFETRIGSDNVFRDLGFPEGEAQNLLLRGNLVIHIRKKIDKLGITQVEAAKRAGISQPRMSIKLLEPEQQVLDEAISWYTNQAPGLGDAFLAKTLKTLKLIAQFPQAWHPLNPQIAVAASIAFFTT